MENFDSQKIYENKAGKIPWEEVIFLAKDLSEDPKMLKISENFCKKIGMDFFENGINILPKITEGLVIKAWLIAGGKITFI